MDFLDNVGETIAPTLFVSIKINDLGYRVIG